METEGESGFKYNIRYTEVLSLMTLSPLVSSLIPLFLLTMNKGFVIILGVIILMLFAIVAITVLVSHKHDMEMINANKKGCTEKDDKQLYICDYAGLCSQNIGNCHKSKIAYKRKNNKKTNR